MNAKVRYLFGEKQPSGGPWRIDPPQKKSVTGPSGHRYPFRAGTDGKSQWLDVVSREDLNRFEESNDFEVQRG